MGRIRHHSAARGGLTLIELLLVMGIAAIIGALTVVSFAGIGRRASREGAAQQVSNLLRRAQVSAVDSGRGAFVRINAAENSLYGLTSNVEAAWHFEEVDTGNVTPGAKRMNGRLRNMPADPVVDGAVGLCLDFDGNGWVDCEQYPIYDQTDGIRIEAWVRPKSVGPGAMLGIMSKADAGGGYGMALVENSSGTGTFTVLGGFILKSGADVRLTTRTDWDIQELEWSHVAIEFDGYEARLFVNGVLADLDSYRSSETMPTDPNPVDDPNSGTDETFRQGDTIDPDRTATLDVGRAWEGPAGPFRYFQGRIDEPRLLSVAGGSPVRLPDKVRLLTSDPVVHFDAQGRLDIAYHSGPIYVALGDPYQAAELALDLPLGSNGPLTLRPDNPMPATRSLVMIGDELVRYNDAVGLQLNNLARGRYRTADVAHSAGERVLFARMIEITPTGVVRRIETGP